jgi:hypothetical protein
VEPGPQFKDYTGGPEEVHTADFRHRHGLGTPEAEDPEGVHPQLFHPESVAMPEAHQQTPAQFAADPRTWWHGRFTGQRSRLSVGGSREGFHAGTQGAARHRLAANAGRRADKPGVAGRLFPLRITGPVSGLRDEPEAQKKSAWGKGGSIVHTELGPEGEAGKAGQGYMYRNVVEGGISVGVPQRKGFLSTHKEMVEEAQRRGEKVHPNIAWAAKKATEHTGEVVPEGWEQRRQKVQGSQMMLQEQFKDTDPHKGAEIARQMFPGSERVEHRSYETEGGKTVHVRAYRGGDAVLGKQWEPDWSRS